MLSGTILVVVVDPHVRRTIQDALVAEGHCVVEAVGRNDAMQSLPDERPDIILVDCESEQESCLDLCRERAMCRSSSSQHNIASETR
jgi:DNA-binding response OmpR family regulator